MAQIRLLKTVCTSGGYMGEEGVSRSLLAPDSTDETGGISIPTNGHLQGHTEIVVGTLDDAMELQQSSVEEIMAYLKEGHSSFYSEDLVHIVHNQGLTAQECFWFGLLEIEGDES